MAESLPSPPASRAATPQQSTTSNHDLRQTLDHLLAQYLELLDKYSTLRADLSKALSNGFLSLANAQRTANIGSGRRYGQDGYDSRMKSLRCIKIRNTKSGEGDVDGSSQMEENLSSSPSYEFELYENKHSSDRYLAVATTEISSQAAKAATAENPPSDSTTPGKPKLNPAYRDPASWYGIFVPQQLRQTQASFISSIEKPIPLLITVDSAMKQLEGKIWDIRQQLGVTGEYTG